MRAALKDWSDEEFESYAKRHYPAYWLKMDLAHKIYHARLLRQLADARAPLVAAVALDNKRGATELTVIAPGSPPAALDRRRRLRGLRRQYRRRAYFHHRRRIGARHHRLFARFLDSTTTNSVAATASPPSPRRRCAARWRSPTRSRRGAPKRRGRNAFSIAPEVVIDNSLSLDCTVLEVSGLDREGLLFEITNAISQTQPQYRLGPCHDVRRARGGRDLCQGFDGRKNRLAVAPGDHKAAIAGDILGDRTKSADASGSRRRESRADLIYRDPALISGAQRTMDLHDER